MSKRAVFLDRDGTLNVDVGYLSRPEDFQLLPGVVGALKRLQAAGFCLVVVTNQSGIARGYFDLTAVERIHQHLRQLLFQSGITLAGIYVCPHHPEGIAGGTYSTVCECRKGKPGMLLEAARDLGLDLARSFMVGDKVSDLEAGFHAGCVPCLVAPDDRAIAREMIPPYCAVVCTDLNSVTDYILDYG